jgi:hypothetical protein
MPESFLSISFIPMAYNKCKSRVLNNRFDKCY